MRRDARNTSYLKPLSKLTRGGRVCSVAVSTLTSSARAALVLITEPSRSSLIRTDHTTGRLGRVNVGGRDLVVGKLVRSRVRSSRISTSFFRHRQGTLGQVPSSLGRITACSLPFISCSLAKVGGLHCLFGRFVLPRARLTVRRGLVDLPKLDRIVRSFSSAGAEIVFAVNGNKINGAAVTSTVTINLTRGNRGIRLAAASPTTRLRFIFRGDRLGRGLDVDHVSPGGRIRTCGTRMLSGMDNRLSSRSLTCVRRSLGSPYARRVTMFQTFTRIIRGSGSRIIIVSATPSKRALLLLSTTRSCRGRLTHSANRIPRDIGVLLPELEGPGRAKIIVIALTRTAPMLRTNHLRSSLGQTSVAPG